MTYPLGLVKVANRGGQWDPPQLLSVFACNCYVSLQDAPSLKFILKFLNYYFVRKIRHEK